MLQERARSAVFIGFETLCRKNQLNAHTLLQRCGIDPLVLRRNDLFVEYARVAEVLSLAARESDNQQFGIQLSQQRDYLVFGPFGLLLSQAESFQDLLRITNKYAHLHAPGIQLEEHHLGELIALEYRLQLNKKVDLRQLIELGMGVVYRAAQALFRESWQLTKVTFTYPEPSNSQFYADFFRAPVHFAQPLTALYVQPAMLHLQPSEQRSQLKNHLIEQFALHQGHAREDYAAHTKMIIQSVLATGEATVSVVARLLNIHPRQLQAELQQRGSSFRALLDEVRYSEAQLQLSHSNIRMTDLALSLGYADETAFSRAFKRWSTLAPRQWRQQVQ
ncbi:MAG: AraC family transcriptional regulator ligand-binding domain-containing protein [Pseudomonas sp.]|nr:AraC family transcriptional regulator ligand-binding domain-containing protein [Pseudomonas sp.]